MKIRFIFNPCSGRQRRNGRLLPRLREFVAAQRLDAEIVSTEGPGHATVLARAAVAAGCERVVAVGGDGTMNEVAQALLHTPAALALVPCGSGNGLARHLGLPGAIDQALTLLVRPEAGIATVDTGIAAGRPFFNAMGLGLDAEVSRRFNQLVRRGLPAYARTALAAFRAHRPENCRISDGGRSETLEALLIAVANSDQYGNGARIAPGARIDDGLLDLVAIRPVGLPGAAVLAARLFLGSIGQSSHVRRWRGTHFRIERAAPGLIHTDGEPHAAAATIEVAVVPHSLRVVVPVASGRFRDVRPPGLAAAPPPPECVTFALNL
jgi:diacylglycerol kinase (ATP)